MVPRDGSCVSDVKTRVQDMVDRDISSDLIRGHIDAIILRVLVDGDNYGYEIMKAVGASSGGEYELKEPSLYACLKRLEKQGYIESYWGDETRGGRRKYYRITQSGVSSYQAALDEWAVAKRIIDKLLGGAGHGRT